MTMPFPSRSRPLRPRGADRALAIALVASVALLAGCNKNEEKPATQVVAKVGKVEITVHQLNDGIRKVSPVPAEQAASANRAVLERLIDQEVTLQKAADQNLDRDSRVVQDIEAARREIISRAYLDKIGAGTPKPIPAEVAAYYEGHPALFKERRVYSLQEVVIEATPEQVESLKKTLASSKTFVDFVNYLKATQHPLRGQRGGSRRRAAAACQHRPVREDEGRPGGLQRESGWRAGSQPCRVAVAAGLTAAGDAGDREFLLNERKRNLIADDLQALRRGVPIVYMGDFAGSAPRSPLASVPEPLPIKTLSPTLGAEITATPQVDVPIESNAASAPTASTIDSGMGFKK